MNFVYCDLDVAILGDIANVHDDVGHLTIMEGKNGAFFDNLQAVHGSQLPAKRSASLFFKLLATERSPKDAFKYARLGSRPWCRYNSSFMIISRDQPDDLWRWLPPEAGDEIRAANLWGSDQAWLHLHKKGRIKTVGKDDGFWYAGEVGKYHRRHRALPDNLNMVIFPGLGSKPWLAEQRGREWVRKVYNID